MIMSARSEPKAFHTVKFWKRVFGPGKAFNNGSLNPDFWAAVWYTLSQIELQLSSIGPPSLVFTNLFLGALREKRDLSDLVRASIYPVGGAGQVLLWAGLATAISIVELGNHRKTVSVLRRIVRSLSGEQQVKLFEDGSFLKGIGSASFCGLDSEALPGFVPQNLDGVALLGELVQEMESTWDSALPSSANPNPAPVF